MDFINKSRMTLPSLQYLLVGTQIPDNDKVIDCKTLEFNIENRRNLCSYTGWYAVSKNKLCKKSMVCLLEYDIDISEQFHNTNLDILNNNDNNIVIAYETTVTDHYVFYKSTPWLEISLKKVHNIDINNFVSLVKNKYPMWPTTTNILMSMQTLSDFIDWFNPMTEYFYDDPLGSYVHERAFFVFCVMHDIKIVYPKYKILKHKQLCSHNNNDIYGKFLMSKNTNILSDDHKIEYDLLYSDAMLNCLQVTNLE